MKLLVIFLTLLSFFNNLFAGAPPMNKDSLPTAPYKLIKTNHIILGVEWEKSTLKEFLPSNLSKKSTITGGINIFNSKKKQDLSPFSGSYGWVDLPANNNKKEKLIIFSIYGPNKTINKIMNSVYNLQSEIGSNKVTLFNDKAIATASVGNKNTLILSVLGLDNCKRSSGREMLITKLSKTTKLYQNIMWKTEEECISTPDKVELKESFERFKVKKLLWSKIQKNSELIFE